MDEHFHNSFTESVSDDRAGDDGDGGDYSPVMGNAMAYNHYERIGQTFIQPELLELVHRHSEPAALPRPEVLENWMYNWQTKERKIPPAMIVAGKAIKQIDRSFQHLKDFHRELSTVSPDLKPEKLQRVDELALQAMRAYNGIIRELGGVVCFLPQRGTFFHLTVKVY